MSTDCSLREKKTKSLHIKLPSYKLNESSQPWPQPQGISHAAWSKLASSAAPRHSPSPRAAEPLQRAQQTRPPGGASSKGRAAKEMGRAPCCDKETVKKGPWAPEEDAVLKAYIDEHGAGGNWIQLPHKIGRCKHRPVYRSSA